MNDSMTLNGVTAVHQCEFRERGIRCDKIMGEGLALRSLSKQGNVLCVRHFVIENIRDFMHEQYMMDRWNR